MAHTFDAKTQIAASTSNPVTGTHTCASGVTVLVLTLIYANGERTGTPTYNGVNLTQVDQTRYAATSPEARAELWYLLDPPTGSAYTISVPNPNGLSLEAVVSSYSAASGNKSVVSGTGGNQSSGSTNPYAKAVVVCATLGVAVVASGADAFAPSARVGTSLYETDNGTWGGGHQYYLWANPGGTGTANYTWTFGTSDDWGAVGIGFSEAKSGVDVSKAIGHAVLTPAKGISVQKVIGHVVQTPAQGISVQKLIGNVVLDSRSYITGSSSGVGSATGTLTGAGGLTGTAAGAGSATGTLTEAAPPDLVGNAYGTSTVTGTLDQPAWEGHAYGTSTATGDLENIGPVDAQVTQTVAEVLATPTARLQVTQVPAEILVLTNAEIQATQTIAEVLHRANTDIEVDQVVAEVLVSGWRKSDFMPILTRFF